MALAPLFWSHLDGGNVSNSLSKGQLSIHLGVALTGPPGICVFSHPVSQFPCGFQIFYPSDHFRASRGARGLSEPSMAGDEIEVGEGKQIHMFHQ